MERNIEDITLNEIWAMIDEYNDIQSVMVKLLNSYNSHEGCKGRQFDTDEPVAAIFTEDSYIYIEFQDEQYNKDMNRIPFDWVEDPDGYWSEQRRKHNEFYANMYKDQIKDLEAQLAETKKLLKEVTDVQ